MASLLVRVLVCCLLSLSGDIAAGLGHLQLRPVSGYNCVLALAYLTCANKWLLLWWESRLLLYSVAENQKMLWG